MPNPEKLHPNTYPNRKSPYQNTAEEKAARQIDAEAWLDGIFAWLPDLIERFGQLPDPRRPASVQHKLVVVLVYGVFLFLWQCASRREGNRELTQPSVVESLQAAFPQLATIPYMDTVARRSRARRRTRSDITRHDATVAGQPQIRQLDGPTPLFDRDRRDLEMDRQLSLGGRSLGETSWDGGRGVSGLRARSRAGWPAGDRRPNPRRVL